MDPVFLSKLYELFPDCKASNLVSRAQIVSVMQALSTDKYPGWLVKAENRASRGQYHIEPRTGAVPAPEQVPALMVDRSVDVREESVSHKTDTISLIPRVDSNYVPFGNYKDIEQIIKSKQFYPVYISGPTGNGKSTVIEQICAKHSRPMIRVNLNMLSDEDQLIGTKTLVDGNVKIVEGPVLIAMRLGIPLLLDEIDASSSNSIMCLQSILEGKPYYFKLKNELITPAPGFNIFATANTKGKGSEDGRYIGTNVLNEAFLERFAVTFAQEYPSPAVEKKIVINLMKSLNCEDESFADSLVKWSDGIRRTFEDGGIDEVISTRRLTHIVRAFSIYRDKNKAVTLCVNRFDNVTRDAFINLFSKISTDTADTTTP
jgi:hypothetical protein